MTHEYLPTLFSCVMLGDGRHVRRLARRLFWKYNMPTLLLCNRLSMVSRLNTWLLIRRLPREAGDSICTLALRHLAAEIQACDRQPLLLLDEQTPPLLSADSLARLESCYLICREDDLDALFASATLQAQGDMTV